MPTCRGHDEGARYDHAKCRRRQREQIAVWHSRPHSPQTFAHLMIFLMACTSRACQMILVGDASQAPSEAGHSQSPQFAGLSSDVRAADRCVQRPGTGPVWATTVPGGGVPCGAAPACL